MGQTKKIGYQLARPQIMWLAVVVGGAILWFWTPPGRLFSSGWWGILILFLGIANWLWVGRISGQVHKQALASVQNINQLITEGSYAVVRHPMYAAGMVAAWCVFIWQPLYKILAIVIWITIVLLFWASFEERMLEEKFLDDYRNYKQRVPMFIPNFKK